MKKPAMIVDKLENSGKYVDLHPGFAKAFQFIKQDSLADLPDGKYEIDGDKIFCMLSTGPGRSKEGQVMEAHKKYIDIQYVISGTDEMGWKHTPDCKTIDTEYNAEKDYMLFKDEPTQWEKVTPGMFTIFFPNDAHLPQIGPGEIHKAVIKVAVEY